MGPHDQHAPEPSRADALYGALGDAVPVPDDVYDRIVREVAEMCQSLEALHVNEERLQSPDPQPSNPRLSPTPVEPPLPPESFAESGLSRRVVSELLLKSLYLSGSCTDGELAEQIRLPPQVLHDPLDILRADGLVEFVEGEREPIWLTEAGRGVARDAFEQSRYLGPAPVSLVDYVLQCRRQSVSQLQFAPEAVRRAFSDLVMTDALLESIGASVCGGHSILLHGPSGNGKTAIARCLGVLISRHSPIYVPYSIEIKEQILTVFDPTVHKAEAASGKRVAATHDRRWVQVRRPAVRFGTDFTLDTLHVQFPRDGQVATVPAHIKANGGLLILDDFGRQLISHQELLNRWILALEQQVDQLRLPGGSVVRIPLDALLVFATNLPLEAFSDPAFLRRVQQKLPIHGPSRDQFLMLFRQACRKLGVTCDDRLLLHFYETRYDRQHPPKMSDPQDLLNAVTSLCRFRGEGPSLTEETLSTAYDRCSGITPIRSTV